MDSSLLLTLASAAAEEGGHATISLFPDIPTMFWTGLNFLILLWALHKFLYKPLLGAIATREEEIQASVKKAHDDMVEADRLRKDLEAKIAGAQAEAQEIISKAIKAATSTKEQIESEARAKAVEMLENATRTIEREKQKALAELREEVASLAVMVAGKVIDKNLDNAEQKRLAESFVAEVGKN